MGKFNRQLAMPGVKARVSKATIVAVSLCGAWFSVASHGASCQFYSYLDFGHDPDVGKVFRSSGVRMYQEGFEAAYSPYGHVKKDGFAIQRLGPFNTQKEAHAHLQVALQNLRREGYRKSRAGRFPRLMLLNKKLCATSG